MPPLTCWPYQPVVKNAGEQQQPESQAVLPRLDSICHNRGRSPSLPPPILLPPFPSAASQPISAPLSRLAAAKGGSGATPALCSSCNWERLQNTDVHSWRCAPIIQTLKFQLQEEHCWEVLARSLSLSQNLRQPPAPLSPVPSPTTTSFRYPHAYNFQTTPCKTQTPLIRSQSRKKLGGPREDVVVSGGSPLTSLYAQHRSQHGEQKRLHGAAMGPRRCAKRRQARCASGRAERWGREKGTGDAQRSAFKPWAALPLRLPGLRWFRFPAPSLGRPGKG